MLVWVRVRVRVELWTNYGRCGGYIVAVGVINEIVKTRATTAALLLLRAVLASTRTCTGTENGTNRQRGWQK